MSEPEDGEIRQLRLALMKADSADNNIDTAVERRALRYRPRKVVST